MTDKAEFEIGVLYNDYHDSNHYHIMTRGSNIKDVLLYMGNPRVEMFNELYDWMVKLRIRALWVFPATLLSMNINRGDFNLIRGYNWFSPDKVGYDGRPSGLRIRDRYIFFPDHMELKKGLDKSWQLPTEDELINSVEYVQRASGQPLLWSPGYCAQEELREIHTHHYQGPKIVPFVDTPLWKEVNRKIVNRPVWSKHLRNDKRGLTNEDKAKKYVHVFDKVGQYLGASASIVCPIGDYVEVGGEMFSDKKVGFWQYTILDISKSPFNGYELYCPLSQKTNWASTNVLVFAQKSGIEIKIERGIVWERIIGKALEKWANKLFDDRKSLDDPQRYPSTIAARNAQATEKLKYIEMIGRFCVPGVAKEYYHPEWNRLTINQAIANQSYTILKRVRENGVYPVLVSTDSIYVLSDEKEPNKAYPGILDYDKQLRGYRHVGTCKLTEEIITAFETERLPIKIETVIKRSVKNYELVNRKGQGNATI